MKFPKKISNADRKNLLIILENFAPSFTPSNCSTESAQAPIGQSAPQWIDADTSEAAERRWLENVPDYMNKDSYDKIQNHIQNEINKPVYWMSRNNINYMF